MTCLFCQSVKTPICFIIYIGHVYYHIMTMWGFYAVVVIQWCMIETVPEVSARRFGRTGGTDLDTVGQLLGKSCRH